MITKLDEDGTNNDETAFEDVPLWIGPSKLTTIRTAPCQPFQSLLKPTFKGPTAFRKQPREGPVHLGKYGFDGDERAYPPHQVNARAVLQYNSNHYPEWKHFLKDIKVEANDKRDALLDVGGFGENIVVEDSPETPSMDESTMCIGDLVSFQGADGTEHARIRVNGHRMPCYKLNHRFGIPSMSQRTQEKGWTGWIYHVEQEGDVEVGDKMVLIDRPFPEWSVSRIQHYCFKEPRNFDMLRVALDTLGDNLLFEIKELFEDRLTKGMEDMSLRLKGDEPDDVFTNFRLKEKSRETDRVSEFVLERVKKLSQDSKEFTEAKPGSHIRLRLKTNGQSITRPYSVISGDSNTVRLGIALADHSRGGSSFLHQTLKVGDELEVSENFANTFALDTEYAEKHVFLAGGIGITAFLDHMKYCLDKNRPFHLHYMIRDESDYAFKTLIEKTMTKADEQAKLTVHVSASGDRANLESILTHIANEDKTHIYVCGSERMTDEIKSNVQKLSIPEPRVHFEQFSMDASGDPFTAETIQTKKQVQVNNRQSLLDALRAAGLEVPSSCEAGNCGTCRVRVKCGRVLHKGTGLIDDEKAGYDGKEEGEMLSCVSRGIGTIEIEL